MDVMTFAVMSVWCMVGSLLDGSVVSVSLCVCVMSLLITSIFRRSSRPKKRERDRMKGAMK